MVLALFYTDVHVRESLVPRETKPNLVGTSEAMGDPIKGLPRSEGWAVRGRSGIGQSSYVWAYHPDEFLALLSFFSLPAQCGGPILPRSRQITKSLAVLAEHTSQDAPAREVAQCKQDKTLLAPKICLPRSAPRGSSTPSRKLIPL